MGAGTRDAPQILEPAGDREKAYGENRVETEAKSRHFTLKIDRSLGVELRCTVRHK